MAVQPQTPYKEYTANGSTNSFALEFDCDNQDHLIVLVDDIEPVVGAWSLIGGAVVFGAAPTNGKKITIQRNTPFRRDGDFQSYDNSFRPGPVNKGFDWVWLKLQELGVADWILSNRIDSLKNYVNQQDGILQDNIDSLKNYVDDKDDELRNYLLNAIQEQGVALDQLEEYYSYLMQQLAQVAIDRGWAASFIVSADGSTQQEINDFGGAEWWNKPGGYKLGATVKLANGDIVKSTVANNIVNPNVARSNWKLTEIASSILATPESVNADPTGVQEVTAALNMLANPEGRSIMFLTKGDFKTGTVSVPANTICYMNGAKFIRKQYTNTPVIDVGENSLIVGAVVDGNKDVLGNSGGLRDYGIRLASGAKALFCTSNNNFKHGITCRSLDLSVSKNQQVLFCNTVNNGFNSGPAGTADGINTANSNRALLFGNFSSGNSRTNYVGETYNTVTADTDITLSIGVRCIQCVAENSTYNSFNFEKVTAPVVDNCTGDNAVVFRGSPNAVITRGTFSAIYAPDADNPTVNNCKIINNQSNNEVFYLTGKNPNVANVDVTIGDSVSLVNTATVYITNPDASGTAENITVNRAYTGVRLNVANASKIRVDSATNAKIIIARPEKSIIITDDFNLEKGRLELRTSAVPVVGHFKQGDAVINNFYSGSIYGWQCTTAGLDATAIWQQIGVRGLSKMTRIADSSATDIAGLNAKINQILAELLSKNHMS